MRISISFWIVAGICFVSFHSIKSQESLTNVVQQTNQIETNQAHASKMNRAIPIQQVLEQARAKIPQEFRDYDYRLISDIENKWDDLLNKATFASSNTGKVVAKFILHEDGSVTDIKISGDTNALVAPFCIQAIKDCSPFPKWPDAMCSIVKTNYREINFTFYVYQQPSK